MPTSNRLAIIGPDRGELKAVPYVLGLENPWGMTFLPSGEMLVTEKAGSVRVIKNGALEPEALVGVPEIYLHGQGGLLDIEIHPQFSENNWIYLSFASSSTSSSKSGVGGKQSGGNTEIIRARLSGRVLSEITTIYKATPNTTATQHFGSRIAFDGEGFLYFTIGDRAERDRNPQSLDLDGGKIYRVFDDGAIPEDNPFPTSKKPAVFSYGHRNPQGLAIQPGSGLIWSHEHGPRGGDELNIIEKGKNYGWPVISYGINYIGTKFAEGTQREGMEQPVTYWVPSIAPCGMSFVKGNRYPGWEGDLLIGSLKFGYLLRVKLEGQRVISQERVVDGIGRVRNVEQGPEGYIYVAVEGSGIYRLES